MKRETKIHLDKANRRYLQIPTIKSIVDAKMDEFDFIQYNEHINNILNIGLGNGIELPPLIKTYNTDSTKIIGVDLSKVSLMLSRQLSTKFLHNVSIPTMNVQFVQVDAINLPFVSDSFDLILMNSLLHEIYSYSPRGLANWKQAIGEATRLLSPNGLLYIEDFISPKFNGMVHLKLKSSLSKEFYCYFREEFRKFRSFGDNVMRDFANEHNLIMKCLPSPTNMEKNYSVLIGASLALEFITHFRIFMNDYRFQETYLGDVNWIEINERYYLSHDATKNLLGLDGYIKMVQAESQSKYLRIVKTWVVERMNFTEPLREHLIAIVPETREDFLVHAAKKMKLLFIADFSIDTRSK